MWEKINLKLSSPKIFLLWLYMPALFFMLIAAMASHHLNKPFSLLTRDPLAITGGHPLLGAISNIGAMLWSFSVAICFFSYDLVLSNRVFQWIMNLEKHT